MFYRGTIQDYIPLWLSVVEHLVCFRHNQYWKFKKHVFFKFAETDFFVCWFVIVCLFCSIYILLSRENDGAAIFWTNPHPLTSVHFWVYCS